MRSENIISDITGKAVKDHVVVTVNKIRGGFKIAGDFYFGPTALDLDESDLRYLDKLLVFKSPESMAMMPIPPEVRFATAHFSPRKTPEPES